LLTTNGITAVPIIDPTKKLIGFVDMLDLVVHVMEAYVEEKTFQLIYDK
jgi:hypothetical protein